MSRACIPVLVGLVLFFICPVQAHAQAKEAFVQALADFVNAAAGRNGDEGAALTAALDAMAARLAEWDGVVAGVEKGLAAEIGGAAPPAAARMRAALGTAYLERGRVEAAAEQFEMAVRLDPGFGGGYLLLGLVLQHLNRPGTASAFRAAWERDTAQPALAFLFLRSAAPAETAETARAAETLWAAIERGNNAGGSLFPVVGLFDEGAVAAPIFPPAFYADGVALLIDGDYVAAVAKLREAATADPLVSDPAAKSDPLAAAARALKQQDPAAAAAVATAAVQAFPSSSEAHRILGTALLAARRFDESAAAFRAAVRLSPRDERSRLGLGDALIAVGDAGAARTALEEAARAVPRSGQLHWELGRLRLAMNDQQGALESFETAASLPILGGAAHVHATIGRLQHTRLNLDVAAEAYTRRVRAIPNDSGAHFDLGEVLRAQEKLPEAMAEYLAAALLDPSSAKAVAAIGLLHAAAGRDQAAVRVLRRAVALDAGHLEARYALSRALLRTGQPDEARRELEVFQQLQAKALEEERRRFRDNQRKIEDALGQEPGR